MPYASHFPPPRRACAGRLAKVSRCCHPGHSTILSGSATYARRRSDPARFTRPHAPQALLATMSTATPAGPIEHRPMDSSALERLERFGGARLLREMIALYVESAPGRLAAAVEALAAGDVIATENAFHSLKSSSAQLGAVRLARLCEEAETIARDGSLSGVAALIVASRDELGRVERWLHDQHAGKQA
jgi:HPt (histidine-containing phosphotransfer) domain-containing protein